MSHEILIKRVTGNRFLDLPMTMGGLLIVNLINNSSNSDSINAQIFADENNVVVTWWKGNYTMGFDPVKKVSNDNGKTFGPLIHLSLTNTMLLQCFYIKCHQEN